MNKIRSPEVKLFLRLSKSIIEDKKENLLEFLRENPIDWNRFKDLAISHELLSFFYQELKDLCGAVPEDFLEILKQNHYAVLIRSQKIWQNFLSIADILRQRHLLMAPIKGISCLADIYRARPFRPMVDIDILVKKEDLSRAKEVLLESGYAMSLGGFREEYWLKRHCELTFCKNGSVPLDVHFGLDFKRSQKPLLPHLWGRIRRVPLDGRELDLLSFEDQLFCLALHQRRYGGRVFSLKNIFDLAMILKRSGDSFDWAYVVREAQAGDMRATVFLILSQAHIFFDAAVPEFVWKGLCVSLQKRKAIEKLIERYTFVLADSQKSKGLYLETHFLLFDGIWEPIRYILNIPLEQFANYYGLKPYTRKTKILYGLRTFYFVWRYVLLKKVP